MLTNSIDKWFESQKRDLESITARADGSPVRDTAEPVSQGTPQSLKDWIRDNRDEEPTAGSLREKGQNNTSSEGFDLWLTRQRKELTGMTEKVESAAKGPMSADEWRKQLDQRSNATLEKWRSSIEQKVPNERYQMKQLQELTHSADESVRELERGLASMNARSESHQSLLKQNELLTDESQFRRLNNLHSNMEDRLYAA
jgi:hypothetical protein